MITPKTAQEIGQDWLEYITDMFLVENGSGRTEVEDEFKRLESTGAITEERELWRTYTDELIEKILQSSDESRRQILAATDARSLSFVYDRIRCGTDFMTAIIQKGLSLNMSGEPSMADYFRKILLQRQS